MQSQTKIFSRLVRDFMRTPPVAVPADTDVENLLGCMAAAKATSALVVDRDGRLTGIITEQDITRRVTLRCTGTESVRAVMTTPVETVAADDYLYAAIARMRRFDWRHMPVVDAEDKPVGTIVLDDALAVAAEQVVRQIDRISHEGTLDGLREIKAAQVDVAADLFSDHVPAPEIQALLTDINRDLHRRVVEASAAAMRDEGLGDPPVPFAVIIMGSGGRGENYLFPDQDNGFILDDYPDAEHGRIDAYFIELAERMTRDLDTIGFPLCNGYVMATNPLWRKTRRQWRDQLQLWGRRRSTIAIQLSDIFFDFVGACGRADFARELRQHASALISGNPAYLREMAHEVHDRGVALGWFGRFLTETEKPEHKGKINLKHAGIMPLVGNIRLLALRHSVPATSTLKRIAALHQAGVLSDDEEDYLSGAYRHISHLLLREQIADFRASRTVGNYVHPDTLSEREKDILVDSLRAIDALRKRLRAEFTGDVF